VPASAGDETALGVRGRPLAPAPFSRPLSGFGSALTLTGELRLNREGAGGVREG
jgi:hypothetical protein